MPRLIIDNKPVDVPAGATILDAARRLGVEIPTLCFLQGHPPNTSCMLCMVKVSGRWLPSCATPAEDGMQVESETPEVRALRSTGLELLLSHHQGDCAAPCEHACPLHVNIPLMLTQVAQGDLAGAMATIRRDVALPSILGRVCGELCERACRRKEVDGPAAICAVERFVVDAGLASTRPYLPPRGAPTGKRVSILGAGPAGLSAAYHLLLAGHACRILDRRPEAGGMLRYEVDQERYPRRHLDREVESMRELGARIELGSARPTAELVASVGTEFDALLLTDWPLAADELKALDAAPASSREHDGGQHVKTPRPGVFLAMESTHQPKNPARLAASGRAAALCVDQYLRSGQVTGKQPVFHYRAGRVPHEEIVALTVRASEALHKACRTGVPPVSELHKSPAGSDLTLAQVQAEALRCLHCDCGKRDGCRLRHYATVLGAHAAHYRAERRPIQRRTLVGDVVYEEGKCILCGICIQVAAAAPEPLGLTFVRRGFDMQVGAVPAGPLSEAQARIADECVRACPTGALSSQSLSCP